MAYGSTPSTSGIAGTINNLPKKADYLGLQDFPSIEFRDTTPFSDNFLPKITTVHTKSVPWGSN